MKKPVYIKFTPPELTALQNKDFFYLKRSATDKIIALFGQIAETMRHRVKYRGAKTTGNCPISCWIYRACLALYLFLHLG
jgi:hypothetical protein